MKPNGFVAVHAGAGFHSVGNSALYKQICKDACLQAIALLNNNKSALEAVQAAMMSLENSPWTNAGVGSSLTVNGNVECDASIMDGKSLHFGAVGAVSGVKNPILVAKDLLETQKQGMMPLGRIPPSTLVGEGAYEWAKKKNIETVKPGDLITDSTLRAYVKHKRKLDKVEEGLNHSSGCAKLRKMETTAARADGAGTTDGTVSSQEDQMKSGEAIGSQNAKEDKLSLPAKLDTVGAVCVDATGRVVSAVSSGGIVLKQSGRVGQAGLYACGCWAENSEDGDSGVGICTSGVGEHLTKTLMAKQCADCLKSRENPCTAIYDLFKNSFLESRFLSNIDQKLGAALGIKMQKPSGSKLQVEVLWVHTTDSMCLAYMSTKDQTPKALISRLPEGKVCGQSILVQSKVYTLT